MSTKKVLILALALLVGLVAGAYILGRSLERFRQADRFISVKGFSEREVKADLAVWSIKTSIGSNDLLQGSREIEAAKNKVVAFLNQNGVKNEEIIQKSLRVTDKRAREYGGSDANQGFRYIIEKTIQVRSQNVDNVLKVSRMTDELLRAGVALSASDYSEGGLSFLFTGLNDIKPEMLAEATRSARQAAEQFTNESQTKLGNLRKASQGLFTIIDRDESLGASEGGYYSSSGSDVYKKVRVVVTVEYSVK
jgi:hypothetical protein